MSQAERGRHSPEGQAQSTTCTRAARGRSAAGAAMRLLPLLCCAALCLPGRAVRGPGTVEGYIGGSLSVSCSYQKGYEKYPKYWCYPGTIKSCSYNTHLVITSEQQPWAQRGRTSIWDNRTARVFTVTVRDLTAGDAGTYRCGVRTHLLQMDVADKVRVTVLPGPASQTDIALPRITPETLPMGTDAPTGTPAPATYTAPGTDTAPDHRGSLPLFPLLAGLQVLALLAMSAAVLRLNLRSGCTRPRPATPHRFSPQ
ncbi:CMRF35-like molecule 2 isoform X5 [Lagopus muta]|uniref:CMRF35-like molecule 2 isoform X5 n=1 Tax=Lagopus muta TaxID=64668 RepID=UPI00209F09E3|nr:CMRF35-like molecule 2 isoform X5 [Lagopus muta]